MGEKDCYSEKYSVLERCKEHLKKVGPYVGPIHRDQCCRIVVVSDMVCICRILTKIELEKISSTSLIYIAKDCGHPLPAGTKCGDSLIDLRVLADELTGGNRRRKRRRQQRKLTDGELVGLYSEFLGAGTEPGAAALQWIMANLVKRPNVQRAIQKEIDAAVAIDADEVGEEVLGRLEYLNAVIMEGLRLHPTVPMVFRQVMPDDHVVLDGRRVAAGTGTAMLFPLTRLSRDKTAWFDPREFRPERFMAGGDGEGVSLVAAAGSAGEIRMMPFGAGRRMCPGMGVAVLPLGYFVANLVREFEWMEAEGDHAVDLRPHIGFFTVMKRPLRARLVRRREDKPVC